MMADDENRNDVDQPIPHCYKPGFIQSETDLLGHTRVPTILVDSPLIYSDPNLHSATKDHLSFAAIPELEEGGEGGEHVDAPTRKESTISVDFDNKGNRLRSELEINAQHYAKQKQYAEQAKQERRRRLTDIDFEGILNIIGGCHRWQIIVYLMISAQQVPHAMFNLSVVYMMYQPDHWCKIPGFNEQNFGALQQNYTWDQVMEAEIAFPRVDNWQRNLARWHDQCHYYDRDYSKIRHMTPEQLMKLPTNVSTKRCEAWDYDKSVMEKTVVTEWNRVCDDNWSRAHVHLSYSLGYLVGCFLGGFVSDRYGRKTTIYGFGILSALFGYLLPYSREFGVFLVVRFLLAASNEAADLAAYVLCMEITGVKYRSIVGSLLQAPWACGYAFLALVAYSTKSWTSIHLFTVVLHCFALVLIHFLPESPRWLIMSNRVVEAEKIIRKACRQNNTRLPSDLGLIRHAEKRKWVGKDEKPNVFHLFRSSQLRLRNGMLFVIWVATALVYYGLVIALSDQSSPGRSVFDGNFFLNNAIAGAIELPTLFACVFLLKYGRKRSQMITLIGAGTLILIAMFASMKHRTTLALIFMLLGKACIQGAFNILYIFTSELNPTVIRNTAVGISSMIARMGAGASGYIAIMSDVTLPFVPMIIFAIFSLFAGILVIFLPETQNMPLPDTIWDAVNMLSSKQKPCGPFKSENKLLSDEEDETPYEPADKVPPT